MKIGNSPQEQLIKNTKDIQELKSRIVEYFTYFGVLDTTQVDCARSNTNVPELAKKGFIIDSNANMFTINDNDGTNLLITYTCNLKGDKGEPGSRYVVEANPEEDATEDLTKLKVDNTIYNVVASGGKRYRHYLTLNGTANNYAGQIWSFIIECDSNLPFVKNTDYIEGTNQNIQKWLREHFYCYSSTSNTPGYSSDNRFALPAMLIRTTSSVYTCQGILVKYDISVGDTDYFYYLPLDANVSLQQITNTTLKDQHIEEIT